MYFAFFTIKQPWLWQNTCCSLWYAERSICMCNKALLLTSRAQKSAHEASRVYIQAAQRKRDFRAKWLGLTASRKKLKARECEGRCYRSEPVSMLDVPAHRDPLHVCACTEAASQQTENRAFPRKEIALLMSARKPKPSAAGLSDNLKTSVRSISSRFTQCCHHLIQLGRTRSMCTCVKSTSEFSCFRI